MDDENLIGSLEKLQVWYHSNCDGDWEHSYGFSLETSDFPGWLLKVDLDDTDQEFDTFEKHWIDQASSNWIQLDKRGTQLRGACGATQLVKMLDIVTDWLRPHTP